jgi:hypothetical protein
MSVLDELDAKRAKVADCRERVAVAERDARESPRRGERERARVLEYHRECAQEGREPDPEKEAELGRALMEATGGLVVRTSPIPYGDGRYDLREELADPIAEARLEGAKAALRDAQGELVGFIDQRIGAIAVARIAKARELAEACDAALSAARRASAEYESERAWWSGLLVEGRSAEEPHPLLGTVPGNELGEALSNASRSATQLPMPEPFVR